MLQEPERVCLIRRNLSRKRMFRFGVDRDDRGWTPLHIGARKGDLKQVSHLSFFSIVASTIILNLQAT